VLTKKEDRVLTIKEACGILCKGTYHSLDGKEEYRFDEKIPKDAITVNAGKIVEEGACEFC
jgi:hypothetical protein